MALHLQPTEAPAPILPPLLGSLTPRQREVALLVGEGLANREIAELLIVDVRTVDTHVEHIFNRLGINSRNRLIRLLAPYLPAPSNAP
jgi:non-specific serine/threonine protein kinase